MNTGIERAITPEEREYQRYLLQVEERKARIVVLQSDLASRELAMERFRAEYDARIGILFAELDRVRLAEEEYERRIAWLRAEPETTPEEVERRLQEEFAAKEEKVRREREEASRQQRRFAEEREREDRSGYGEAEARRLYMDLARCNHPDLARTDEERRQREPLMQRINAAFRARDLDALRSLANQTPFTDAMFEAQSIGEKLVWAIREVARLDGMIDGLHARLNALAGSELHGLWERQQRGDGVIERLEEELRAQIFVCNDRFAALVAVYRQVVESRSGAG